MNRLLLLVFLLFSSFAFAEDFPERPNPPRLVNDMAGILSAGEVQQLESKLVAFNDSTSTQIAIVTITSIGGYSAADYSFRLAERWGIGQKGKDNGILILVAKDSRDVFIATGYGMEEFVPDALAKRIVNNEIIPNFKQGNYYAGLDRASTLIMGLVSGKFKPEDVKGPATNQQRPKTSGFMIIIIIILIILFMIKGGRGGGRGMRTIMGPRYGGGWGSFSSGGGIFGGGGGFGGFGGGGFGGGGAGGRW